MYENLTYERIMGRVLANVPNNVDKRQGSVIYDAVAPVCSEIAQIYIALDNCINESFADTAQRDYLILRAKEIGLSPKEATKAVLRGEFQGNIDIGDRFALDDLRYTVTERISNGIYKLQCDTAGSVGNTKFGTLIPLEYNPYLVSAVLTSVITEGEDEEDTESFRERYFENIGSKGYGGNKADYINWAKAINGVGQARAIRAYAGGGTVKVVILNSDNAVPSDELCAVVKKKLDPAESTGCGEGIAPIGHRVNVVGAKARSITININVSINKGYLQDDVKESIKQAVIQYFNELNSKFSSIDNITVSSLQIISKVCNIEGITTISQLNIDGQSSIVLAEDEICGEPVINMEV